MPPGQAPDVVRERGREHQVLAARREQRDDLLDVGQEAHVEHPVRLVKDEDLHLAEVRDLLPDQVEQPARGRDQDLDPTAQRLDLRIHRDPAVHDGRAQGDGSPVGLDAGIDLHRELAGRDEDEDPHRMTGGGEARVGVRPESIEDRQHEGRGLAGAGLGRSQDVAALEDKRDGGRLDGRRCLIALVCDHAHEVGRQAE